jgi:hypothetical protein
MATGDNNRYVRSWFEVTFSKIGFWHTRSSAHASKLKWFPFANGGETRKWFGNNEHVVMWENDGALLQTDLHESGRVRAHNFNLDLIFSGGLTWSLINAHYFGARILPRGFLFSSGAPSLFSDPAYSFAALGFLNCKLASYLQKAINPTLNNNSGDSDKLPFVSGVEKSSQISEAVEQLIALSEADWNLRESAWDFRDQQLLRPGLKGETLEASWRKWEAQSTAAIRRMQELETENNRLWINAYGLQDELTPEVPEEQITLARPEQRKDVAAFLSYATGCMMGRYSLDYPGLILANAGDTLENYVAKVGKSTGDLSFQPDCDGIIPVLDGEWFEDDIVARSREFLRVCFPASSLNTDLAFIETALGKDLRKYFCSDFYKDHLQTYKKRPIYWLVQSPAGPSRGGFACLIYLHRYTKDTLNLVLNNYFRPYLQKLEARQAQLGLDQLNDDLPTRDRTAARKEAEKITKVLKDCQAWEQDALLPLAQQRIELDLDDGVKVNYLKLQDVLAPIPGLAAKEE